MCLHQNAEPGFRLKEPAIAGYTYNPSKPPFEKGGFVVSLSAYLTEGERYLIILSQAAILHFGKP